MNFQHPTFHDISVINAAVQTNEEEEHERRHRAKPLPSDELPPVMAVFLVILFVLVIVLAIVFS